MLTYSLEYVPSGPAYRFQGTLKELRNHLKRTNAKVRSGSNGSWILSTSVKRRIYEIQDGKILRDVAPDKYFYNSGVRRITRLMCENLVFELNQGTISFDALFC